MKSTIKTKEAITPPFQTGDLVEDPTDGTVVLVTGPVSDQKKFNGVILLNGSESYTNISVFVEDFPKSCYNIFKGSVTLEN